MTSVLVDNDVILKMSCYSIVDELLHRLKGASRTVHYLGVARFVLSKAVSKRKYISNREKAAKCLEDFFTKAAVVEPNSDELALAAQFEEVAQSQGLALDSGESQLLSVLICRGGQLLVTGDKRAIRAMKPIVYAGGLQNRVLNRIACLEQVVLSLLGHHGAKLMHQRICGEADVDISLAICFSCKSGNCDHDSIVEGLASYIRDVRKDAEPLLVESDDLSTVIA